ncbi:MAG: SURF1 family protein [Pseudomonadota bacterium]
MNWLLRIIPLAAGLALIALFVNLGNWQSERAAFKDRLFADFDAASSQPPSRVGSLEGLPDYSPVEIDVALLPDVRIYLENQLVAGRDGVHLYRPATLADRTVVLVNFGWQPVGQRRELPPIPDVQPAATVAALVAPMPPGGIRLGELDLTTQTSPFRVPWLDRAQLASRLNLDLAPQILLLTADSDVFVREWRPVTMEADRHRGYAFQWYALAAAVSLFTVWGFWRALLRRPGPHRAESS